MKLTIEPTERFFLAGDVMVRLWTGTTDSGALAFALVAGVSTDGALPPGAIEIPPPHPEDARRWAEEVLSRAGA